MNRIRFLDPKMDTFYVCMQLLRKRFWKLKSVFSLDVCPLVYNDELKKEKIFVKISKFTLRGKKQVGYIFLYEKNGQVQESYPFHFVLGMVDAEDEVLTAYNYAMTLGKQYNLVELLKYIDVGKERTLFTTYSSERVFNDITDLDGHEETTEIEYNVKCLRINPETKRKEYGFVDGTCDKVLKMTFEIVD